MTRPIPEVTPNTWAFLRDPMVALGVAAVFIETHEDPENAPSDGPNMVPLRQMPQLVRLLMQFDGIAKSHPIEI